MAEPNRRSFVIIGFVGDEGLDPTVTLSVAIQGDKIAEIELPVDILAVDIQNEIHLKHAQERGIVH